MSDIANTRFAIIGCGGLGGPIAYALAAAGAGRIALCDDDLVELSNLQRQVQFTTDAIGQNKVHALADELERRGYPRERMDFIDEPFEANGADWIIEAADVIVDGTDNFPTKFLINDRCVAAGRRFAIGAIHRYGGQVMAVRPGAGPCYRCLFEAPPSDDDPLSCSDAGVLGAVCAVIGGLTARAAMALATGDEAGGQLDVYDDLRRSVSPRRIRFNPRRECSACAALPSQAFKEAL